MNKVRERILNDLTPYSDFSEHKDLISFYVSSECFEDWEDEDNWTEADFSELLVIVEKMIVLIGTMKQTDLVRL